jgi:transcription-repair coupling factor (superfamily II helicase)
MRSSTSTTGSVALAGVETLDTGEARQDCVKLDYAGGTSVLVPMHEMDRIWRYGAEASGVTLDKPGGDAWPRRRAEAEREAGRSAERLLQRLAERERARAPALVPPPGAMARVEAGFRHEPTPDQASAIAATLQDLAQERPMDRLVCGDVGFGKTEVALRAAAAAALAGRQVALLAPTTVLVRQHLDGFRRRLAPLGIRVEALSRLTPPAEARAVRDALAKGEVGIAIGTQALAATSVRFRDLALVIVDEEQRFGTRQKAALTRLSEGAGVHRLTLTATPIPQTLASALIGLRALSVIATPPARRQPVRTLRGELDDALLAQRCCARGAAGGRASSSAPASRTWRRCGRGWRPSRPASP